MIYMNVFSKIKNRLKLKYDSIANKKLKINLLIALPYWIAAFVTGLISVLYAKLFSWSEIASKYVFVHSSWAFFIISPLCFLLARWLVVRYAPFANGSGIPQVTAAIDLSNPQYHPKVNNLLGIRIIVVKIASSLSMIFGGGLIGREGPTIQISASVFKMVNELLPDWYPRISRRNMIVTGAAAGLASAFNTPLGGIVFAIEELTKTHFNFFKSAVLTGVIIAGFTALTILGPYLYLGYPQINNVHFWMIFLIIPVSFISGISGSAMGKVILFVLKKKNTLRGVLKANLYVIACGLAIASFAVFLGDKAFGSGKEIMLRSLFGNDKYLGWQVPLFRITGTILSFSTGAAGGVFAPSLSAGASIGAVFSGIFHLPASETNLIVLCGMVGFLTGITRSPFTSSILVIEMTNDHSIIFHLMLSALFANLVSNFISTHSFYDHLKNQYVEDMTNDGI
jgi:H+/Cl- antiporter ClcA